MDDNGAKSATGGIPADSADPESESNSGPNLKADVLARARAAIAAAESPVEGGVEVLDWDEDRVLLVRLGGGCQTCPASSAVVVKWIEDSLRTAVPEVRFVEPTP